LNKTDQLTARFANPEGVKAFKAKYPAFTGQTTQEALDFLSTHFMAQQGKRPTAIHKTCALDTEGISLTWESAHEYLIVQGINDLGYLS